MIDWTSLLGLMGGNKKPAGAMPMVQQKNGMADFSEYLKGGTPTGAAPAQKTPWLNREGMGGLSKGELLMAGMGMLSGKNMQQGFSNAGPILYGGMERKRADQEKQQKSAALTRAMAGMNLTPEQKALYGALDPAEVMSQFNSDRGFNFQGERAKVADTQWQDTYDAGRTDRTEDVDYRNNVYQAGRDDRTADLEYRDQTFDENVRQFGLTYALDQQRANAATKAADKEGEGYRKATPEEVAAYGLPENTVAQISPKGQLSITKDAPDPPKPLVSSETMPRLIANLPNMKQAVVDLKGLMGNRGTEAGKSAKGRYSPGQDWGAQAIDAVPDFGLLQPVAKWAGGKDYQKFEAAYKTFTGAILPILSGSAVSPAEKENILSGIEVRNGDSDTVAAQKLKNMDNMTIGLEAAVRGDTDTFYAMLNEVGSYGASLSNDGQTQAQPGSEIDGADNVPEGTLVQDENGQKWRKQNGQMVRAD